jgi:hypothetical protein
MTSKHKVAGPKFGILKLNKDFGHVIVKLKVSKQLTEAFALGWRVAYHENSLCPIVGDAFGEWGSRLQKQRLPFQKARCARLANRKEGERSGSTPAVVSSTIAPGMLPGALRNQWLKNDMLWQSGKQGAL